jgi:hypothetical protein
MIEISRAKTMGQPRDGHQDNLFLPVSGQDHQPHRPLVDLLQGFSGEALQLGLSRNAIGGGRCVDAPVAIGATPRRGAALPSQVARRSPHGRRVRRQGWQAQYRNLISRHVILIRP